ncbi:hypothetical protein L1987_65087 [Smallanthus sonchifolius]|uniref:Uncharacterized protein n=1 Tax=Smallanthus sonchifolius TaxID=185202 RepID=A0ACB9BTP4_9ASTR|nr:hypothetical protein L1987_65087 [Smallanthus sonchifolius]
MELVRYLNANIEGFDVGHKGIKEANYGKIKEGAEASHSLTAEAYAFGCDQITSIKHANRSHIPYSLAATSSESSLLPLTSDS